MKRNVCLIIGLVVVFNCQNNKKNCLSVDSSNQANIVLMPNNVYQYSRFAIAGTGLPMIEINSEYKIDSLDEQDDSDMVYLTVRESDNSDGYVSERISNEKYTYYKNGWKYSPCIFSNYIYLMPDSVSRKQINYKSLHLDIIPLDYDGNYIIGNNNIFITNKKLTKIIINNVNINVDSLNSIVNAKLKE
jgi:hypothetical protein